MFHRPSPPPTGETSRNFGEPQQLHISQSHAGQHVMILADPGATDEFKLKAAQELSENFELIVVHPQYPAFLDLAIKKFLKILQDGEVHFIAENSMQQVRKLILEMIHRLPTNDYLRPHMKSILALMLKLLGTDNEENVLVCLRIIIELHKKYTPQFSPEILKFLSFVKNIYRELPNHMHRIFEPRAPIKVNDISDLNIKVLLNEIYSVTMIQRERKSADDAPVVYNLIPKGILSLQVLQELPIILVFMFQLYKDFVHQDVAEFIPLIMAAITLQPTAAQRANPNFNKEIYVDFVGAQIKTLSFLAYIIKIYQELICQHASYMVKGVLGLLAVCPPEVAHLRKEVLVATRYILCTELRIKFVPYVDKLCDKNVLLGKGFTTHESVRSIAYSTLGEFLHQVREALSLSDLTRAVHLFAMNVHDDTLQINIQTMSCKLLVNLVDCIRRTSEKENGNGKEILLRMLEVFVLKFKSISKTQIPFLLSKCKPAQAAGAASGGSGGGAAAAAAAAAGANNATSISTLLKLATNSASSSPTSSTSSMNSSNTPFTPLITGLPSLPGALSGTLGPAVGILGSQASLGHAQTLGAGTNTGPTSVQGSVPKEEKSRFGFPVNPTCIYTVADCRVMVKTLVCGVKTIIGSCSDCKGPDNQPPSKIFQTREIRLFIRLVKWAMKAFDIYSLTVNPTMPSVVVQSPQRAPVETDVLKHFASAFTTMQATNFQEIFSHCIEYMVSSISRNPALQVLANYFLEPADPNTGTSPIFATILLEYLLERMDEIGNNMEKSNLYLKLFKVVFGNVAEYPVENEHMLRPHLHKIVNRSMDLAMTAKDPYIYFLLLRALFHSIGGGKHDLLYQEFLPLLPNLLQGLNTLQSGLHKQHMKDLFVELCLTVPVRLSSLLSICPYLSMLMEPLVSALNGSKTLNCQGLQTLELCVNNLQLDCFYECIQPVRAELMQALWRIVSHPNDQLSHVAYRVLGKFGGGNRKVMAEPQKLNYSTKYSPGPCISIHFMKQHRAVEFPIEKVIETAYNALKTSSTDPEYRRQSWEVIRCYLIASLDLSETKHDIQQFFSHPSFSDPEEKISPVQGITYKMSDKQSRQTHQTAITAMFVAATIKELTKNVLPTLGFIVSHYTMLAIAQQAGPFSVGSKQTNLQGMDALVLIDALAVIMGHEEKELCKAGHLAMVFLLKIASNILGSEERACRLLIMEYLAERMCSLCYDCAWYAKLGGCIAIKFMFERMPLRWVFEHLFLFLKSLLFVMMDLTGEVSGGAIDMAKTNLEKLLTLCASPIDRERASESLLNVQQKCLFEVTYELIRRVTSPNTLVREQAKNSLEDLARIQKKTVTEVMEPHKAILQDMIPPVKHRLCHQPANVQIGIMDGNTFCTTLEPRLFTIDLTIPEHESFFNELKSLCEADDVALKRLPCYKTIRSLIPLRRAAYRVLAACHYIESHREQIFNVLYGALEKSHPDVQKAGLESMKKFIAGFEIDMAMVHAVMRPLLCTLGDYRNLTLNGTKRLSYLTMLFPASFKEVFLEKLLQHLIKLLEILISQKTTQQCSMKIEENEKKIATIISIFCHLPSISGKSLESVCRLILQTEKRLSYETTSPFRDSLMKYLMKFPQETVDLFLSDNNVKDQQWNIFLEYMIKHEEGKTFRGVLQKNSTRLTVLALAQSQNQFAAPADRAEMQYMSIRITSLLIKFDDIWLSSQHQLVKAYKNLWNDDSYLVPHKKLETVEAVHWKEPKLLCRVLLHYFCHHPNDVDLLFQLLRALCDSLIPDFQFLRDFLENTVSQNYTVEWKRSAFFRFIEHFQTTNLSQELKAKILQLILIPCFAVSFEKGEGEKLISGNPSDPQSSENVISVFISKAIDPDNPFANSDAVRIYLLQFSCLLLEQASCQFNTAANKRQDTKEQRLFLFASPGLRGKKCVDPTTRYHGHLLLCHYIAKFEVHKRIKEEVFQSLLKAHVIEARAVVRQALEILTPLIPVCMDDGYTILTHWTKKIIVEEGHSMQQLFHILQLVVRHFKVYFPVRHYLVTHMVSSMRRLCSSPNAPIEHRKLAVELAEVVIKWDLQRIKDEADCVEHPIIIPHPGKRPACDVGTSVSKKRRSGLLSGHSLVPAMIPEVEPDYVTPIDRANCEAVLNFLLRLACQVNDKGTTLGSPGELLSKRCVALLKTALKPDVWPYSGDLKLNWLDKVFMGAEGSSPNYGNICTALEILTYLLGIMKRKDILSSMKPLQRGVAACISSSNSKVVRLAHSLIFVLMGIFPPEPTTANVASKYEALKSLYTSVGEFILDSLTSYEKNPNATPAALYGALMMLKSACLNNQTYIDRFIVPYMRALQRMTREHLTQTHKDQASMNLMIIGSELLILGLDLVKNRVCVMSADMRKNFIGGILVGLIEKTTEVKVMKAICNMLEDWIKNKNPIAVNQTPTLREKSILLVKMMQHFDSTIEKRNNLDKRFPDDLDLQTQFLEIINFIYRDEALRKTELVTKLESAFLLGLRCTQPAMRAKFFQVFDSRMERRIHDRLLYIMVQQNWEPMGPYYWIKQCIELLIVTARQDEQIRICGEGNLVPPITAALKKADTLERKRFYGSLLSTYCADTKDIKEEVIDISEMDSPEKEIKYVHEKKLKKDPGLEVGTQTDGKGDDKKSRKASLQQLIEGHSEYVDSIRNTRTIDFLLAMAQLCHMDKNLAERVWLDLFPRVWNILNEKQQNDLVADLIPFLSSGAHVIQRDCQPSALNTFVEALTLCENPPIAIKPTLMKYIGKQHNMWHRMTLKLEQLVLEAGSSHHKRHEDCYDFEPTTTLHKVQEVVDNLSDMYQNLREEDMWCGLWQKHARYVETTVAIAYETQGFFEQAQSAYEVAMSKIRGDSGSSTVTPLIHAEMKMWEERWIRCSKELNKWNLLLEYGADENTQNPLLVLDSAWRVPNWPQMAEALTNVEHNCPKEMAWKLNLYKGYVAICTSETVHLNLIKRYVENCWTISMREWRRLPSIVSHIHLKLLQASQQIMELQEATHARVGTFQDMKAIVKIWFNRLPVISDDLSHWSDIFTWRQHHYTHIATHFDEQHDQAGTARKLGVQTSAKALIHFGKIARKHGLINVCLNTLSHLRLHTAEEPPLIDCFQGLRQQVKCYVQKASILGRGELQKALDIIDSNLMYFKKVEIGEAEFFAYKGSLLAQLGRSEEANKALSAAVQLNDKLTKGWGFWGEYFEKLFTHDPSNISYGQSAIICFLHACRLQNESKARKYLAKVLWLLTYDDSDTTLLSALHQYEVGTPPLHWLPWIPQLLTCLVNSKEEFVVDILIQVGRMFPQAVFLPTRTMVSTLKLEQRERYLTAEMQANLNKQGTGGSSDSPGSHLGSTGYVLQTPQDIPATEAMKRCLRLLKKLRNVHPIIVSYVEGIAEGIVDQLVQFRETWSEEVLRQLRQGLAKCQAIAFENRGAVTEATITQHALNFVKKVVDNFGVGIDLKAQQNTSSGFSNATSESFSTRTPNTVQDHEFELMKLQFTNDFDFTKPESVKLHNSIQKLRKWINILDAKVKTLPKAFLIENKCRFLSNFSLQTAEVELPGEFLLPKHSRYYVRIARFMPRVDIVLKHNSAARRLYIKGNNGKCYPYLVVNDSGVSDARREERVLQLVRMMNHYLGKQKETVRRFLQFTVPRVVPVSPQLRLVEDNPSSISLLDIYNANITKAHKENDEPIGLYYERLAAIQARGSQASIQVLREILQEIQLTTVPCTMLHDWAIRTFPGAADYWTFRKMFTLQLALACFAEYVFHLTRMNPDMMYLHQDSGLMNISYFKFDVIGDAGNLDSSRPVPFRLTPNIVDFISMIGVKGPLTSSMIAVARCLVQPNFKVQTILLAILRDEMIAYNKKKPDCQQEANSNSTEDADHLVNMCTRAASSIMTRLTSLANFDGVESKVGTLVAAAMDQNNLCRMDPAWHPWL